MLEARLRHIVLVCLDAFGAAFSVWAALHLRFDGRIPSVFVERLAALIVLFLVVRLAVLWATQTYKSLWRYASLREGIRAGFAILIGSAVLYAVVSSTGFIALPRSVFAIEAMLFALAAGAPRLLVRWRRSWLQRRDPRRHRRVLIIGAGDAGAMLVREFEQQPDLGVKVVGLVDDDRSKINRSIGRVRVLGGRKEIPHIVKRHPVDQIIIAMPSVKPEVLREIVTTCRRTGVQLKTLPPIRKLISGKVRAQDVRDVRIEDLLQREPVETDLTAISGYLRGKRVLVTGAGGSIGSELCRQVCAFEPDQLILLDSSENSIFEIDAELKHRFSSVTLIPVIADIRYRAKIQRIFARFRPHVVFHAAAHKHVPLMEANPDEAVANNVLGTGNVADAAAEVGTQHFVLISTDKAVNPANVMGASKRMAELVIQAKHVKRQQTSNGRADGTKFVAVRFGNVLDSRGSVIPIFREQIQRGGPVTVTHQDMTRYFMTIPESVQLIIQAAAIGRGGEVFVLDMGEPVRILDLAEDLIRLSGLEPGEDIEIAFTGIRPGEKLYEELVNDDEAVDSTSHDKILALQGEPVDPSVVARSVEALETLVREGLDDEDDAAELQSALYSAVGGQTPDWAYAEVAATGDKAGS